MEIFDYKRDDAGDLVIENGDFVKTESTEQHQKCLILACKGEYKEHPTIGVGLINYILTDGSKTAFKSAVTKEFERDGMKILAFDLQDWDNLKMQAEYR